jgi:hypothetical protein
MRVKIKYIHNLGRKFFENAPGPITIWEDHVDPKGF